MNTLSIIGRVIFSIPFFVFGTNHFLNTAAMAAYVPPFIPGPVIWVYALGAAMILAGLCIITSFLGETASICLALMLLTFVVTIHIPGLFNPEIRQIVFVNLFKDLGLLGGALVIAGSFHKAKADKAAKEQEIMRKSFLDRAA